MRGGPGGCKNQEECGAYCSDESHIEECMRFQLEIGEVSEEEYNIRLEQFRNRDKMPENMPQGPEGQFGMGPPGEIPQVPPEGMQTMPPEGMQTPPPGERMPGEGELNQISPTESTQVPSQSQETVSGGGSETSSPSSESSGGGSGVESGVTGSVIGMKKNSNLIRILKFLSGV